MWKRGGRQERERREKGEEKRMAISLKERQIALGFWPEQLER